MHATCAEFNQFDTALVQQFVLSSTQSAADPLIRTDWIDEDESEEINDTGSEECESDSEDMFVSPGSSRDYMPGDNNDNSDTLFPGRQQDSEDKETEETSEGTPGDDSEVVGTAKEYTITITGDYDTINEFLKERDDERSDNDNDDEIVEYDFISDNEDLYRDGSPEQSDSESGAYSSEVGSDDSDFQELVVTELGYISGFLCFIIVIICLKYIYKFFKLFF